LKVAVIGAGKMGRWFAKFFHEEGFSVVVSSRTKNKLKILKNEFGIDIAKNNIEALKGADWVLICVSLDGLDNVLTEIGPHLKHNQVVMDISSIKEIPLNLLHKHVKNAITLGTHPVFGPGARNLEGQNYVLTPIKEKEKEFSKKFKGWLEERGASVTVMSPKKHDVLMSLVLGFPHFVGLVAGDTLKDRVDFLDAKSVGGATYKLLLTLVEAVSSEEQNFYSNLHMSLPEIENIENIFLNRVEEWLQLVKNKDCHGFALKMSQVKKKLKELDPDYENAYSTMYKLMDNS
jgi:prephenate dehydrogenase